MPAVGSESGIGEAGIEKDTEADTPEVGKDGGEEEQEGCLPGVMRPLAALATRLGVPCAA